MTNTEEITCAADAIVARSDEIVTACEEQPDALREIFSRKGIHFSIDICMGFAAAVARAEWDKAAKEGYGYSSYKALAQAV